MNNWIVLLRGINVGVRNIVPMKQLSDMLVGLVFRTFKLIFKVAMFYLHAPDNIGSSKLAEKVAKILGVPTTARNWNTVTKILTLAGLD
jgi:uncharacterized protein (DUF1697 family)